MFASQNIEYVEVIGKILWNKDLWEPQFAFRRLLFALGHSLVV